MTDRLQVAMRVDFPAASPPNGGRLVAPVRVGTAVGRRVDASSHTRRFPRALHRAVRGGVGLQAIAQTSGTLCLGNADGLVTSTLLQVVGKAR